MPIRGQEPPTLYHWHRAFGAAFFAEVVTAGNFGGRGAQSTERLNDAGPFGTYGQAGNVKEWLWNETDGQRYILGGSWNEPVYMAVEDDRRPPLDRADTNGFRCMKESAPSPAAAYAAQAKTILGTSPRRSRLTTRLEIFRRFYWTIERRSMRASSPCRSRYTGGASGRRSPPPTAASACRSTF